jgi:hypothetical protein
MSARHHTWIVIAGLVAGCRAGYRRVRVVEELPAGTCSVAAAGESCEIGARDYSAGVTLGAPSRHRSDLAGTAWFRWPLFDVLLDQRLMRRGTSDFRSLAGGVGTHLRPLIFWPKVQRYVDVVLGGGFELGGLYRTSHVEGRGDGFLGAALDLFAPDVGQLRYLSTGVPGVRFGVRYTAFVQGWDSETTFEIGLIWRWGVPIDLHHYWKTQRSGD